MSDYMLTYYDVTGHTESFKYMFHYGGINFKDAQLPIYRQGLGLPKVPNLVIDGKKCDEIKSIGRYLAKKCMLYGLNEDEALEIDAAVDSIERFSDLLSIRRSWRLTYTLPTSPEYLDRFEKQINKNGGYFACGKLSWADFFYAAHIGLLPASTAEDIHKNHPELKKLVSKVHALSKIKAYLNNCPTIVSRYMLTYCDENVPVVLSFKYMFHYGGINFEDVHLDLNDWRVFKMKENHQTDDPVLEINGNKYNQLNAFSRYLAKKCNLYGSDDIEALEIDAAADSIVKGIKEDVENGYWESNPNIKKSTTLDTCLNRFEKQVKGNGGYFVRGKLSWADILYAAIIRMLYVFTETDIHKDYPELKKLVDKVYAFQH